jgi:hypothetical protein
MRIAFKTPVPALPAQVNCAYACTAASHADAWLAEHFQKQNALKVFLSLFASISHF